MSTPVDFLLLPKPPQSASLSSTQWTGLLCSKTTTHPLNPFFPKTLPPPPLFPSSLLRATSYHRSHQSPLSSIPSLVLPLFPPSTTTSATTVYAGRSKKKPGGSSPGRIEGNAEARRQGKAKARVRSRRLSENLFYRRSRVAASNNFPDSFTDDELQAIGLGYDRAVRFMSKDDPNLRHPYDWYKYGRYGPYSWRGIVVGPPIRGRFSDDRVTLIGEVRDHEEWEEIEQFEMSSDYCSRLDPAKGLRFYWVFVRHPKWRPSELPWQQWTLAAEVAMEAGTHRLDKWNLMARLGNNTRAMITQCAAWMRPDIIYVKKPVYQCRFEPQDDFFKLLGPLLDPSSERGYPCELRLEDGRVESCTYFGGLCKIVKISPKAYVDDVVKAYQKLSDEAKSRCLEFLLTNHPMELLHPYTKEWKAKLEEMELGCDAPDDSDDDDGDDAQNELQQVTDWIEDDGQIGDQSEDEDDVVIDMEEDDDDDEEDETVPEETEEYWNEQWKKAMRSSDEMEKLVKRSIEISNVKYQRQVAEMQQGEQKTEKEDLDIIDVIPKQSEKDWINDERESAGYRETEKDVKRKIAPELFLRSSVRLFTYRNLVKEIVLMRHAIIDGDIVAGG